MGKHDITITVNSGQAALAVERLSGQWQSGPVTDLVHRIEAALDAPPEPPVNHRTAHAVAQFKKLNVKLRRELAELKAVVRKGDMADIVDHLEGMAERELVTPENAPGWALEMQFQRDEAEAKAEASMAQRLKLKEELAEVREELAEVRANLKIITEDRDEMLAKLQDARAPKPPPPSPMAKGFYVDEQGTYRFDGKGDVLRRQEFDGKAGRWVLEESHDGGENWVVVDSREAPWMGITADTCLFPGCLNDAIPELDGNFCSAHAMCVTMSKREIERLSDGLKPDGLCERQFCFSKAKGPAFRFCEPCHEGWQGFEGELEEFCASPARYNADGVEDVKARILPIPPGVSFEPKVHIRRVEVKAEDPDAFVRQLREDFNRHTNTTSGPAPTKPAYIFRDGDIEAVHPDDLSPYEAARLAFNEYAGMDDPKLPGDEHSALQVLLARWEVKKFATTNAEESILGANEENGEWADALIMLAGATSAAGRMAQCIIKRRNSQRGMEDPEVYRRALADAIADFGIFAIGAANKARLDFWTIISETALEVMDRNRPGKEPPGWKVSGAQILVPSDKCAECGNLLGEKFYQDVPGRGNLCINCLIGV